LGRLPRCRQHRFGDHDPCGIGRTCAPPGGDAIVTLTGLQKRDSVKPLMAVILTV
jgi:hypothetical protein